MNKIKIYEVFKEYKMVVEGLDFPIMGRVVKRVNTTEETEFFWEMSHCFQSSIDARGHGQTFKEAEALLMFYMESFKNIGLEINPFY